MNIDSHEALRPNHTKMPETLIPKLRRRRREGRRGGPPRTAFQNSMEKLYFRGRFGRNKGEYPRKKTMGGKTRSCLNGLGCSIRSNYRSAGRQGVELILVGLLILTANVLRGICGAEGGFSCKVLSIGPKECFGSHFASRYVQIYNEPPEARGMLQCEAGRWCWIENLASAHGRFIGLASNI